MTVGLFIILIPLVGNGVLLPRGGCTSSCAFQFLVVVIIFVVINNLSIELNDELLVLYTDVFVIIDGIVGFVLPKYMDWYHP
jgi:hypothetical protein